MTFQRLMGCYEKNIHMHAPLCHQKKNRKVCLGENMTATLCVCVFVHACVHVHVLTK